MISPVLSVHNIDTEPGHAREIEILETAGGQWVRFVEVRERIEPVGFEIIFDLNGIRLSSADFPRTLEGWTAYSIAIFGSIRCRDKAATLALLTHEAEGLIERARTGEFPGGGS